jgi:peptidoglycan/LPS O-acetylase OafA/YrhL
MKKRHFQTFDALRFFAFFKVFLFHLPITAFPFFSFLKAGGGLGVIFFFVLSGFLITYIILEEKDQTGKLNLYHFFARRILRIWPLYYLMITFAFCTPMILSFLNLQYSDTGYKPDWFMSLTFLENYKMIFAQDQPNVSPLNVMWSLCIEEHFYIIWGLSLFIIRIEKVPVLIISAILIANISRYVFYINGLSFLDILTNFDYFAFGAIPAFLLIRKEQIFDSINRLHTSFKISLIILILTYIIVSPHLFFPLKDLIEPTIFGISFSAIIFLIASGQNRIRIGDNNLLSRLGIFTYGLYLFHTIVINLLVRIFQKLNFSLDLAMNAIIFSIIAFLITVLVSVLSYHLFEKQFLKLKKYFY